jgi:hypothetical protein
MLLWILPSLALHLAFFTVGVTGGLSSLYCGCGGSGWVWVCEEANWQGPGPRGPRSPHNGPGRLLGPITLTYGSKAMKGVGHELVARHRASSPNIWWACRGLVEPAGNLIGCRHHPHPPPPPTHGGQTLHLGVCALFSAIETADDRGKAKMKLGTGVAALALVVLFWREPTFWALSGGAGALVALLYKL